MKKILLIFGIFQILCHLALDSTSQADENHPVINCPELVAPIDLMEKNPLKKPVYMKNLKFISSQKNILITDQMELGVYGVKSPKQKKQALGVGIFGIQDHAWVAGAPQQYLNQSATSEQDAMRRNQPMYEFKIKNSSSEISHSVSDTRYKAVSSSKKAAAITETSITLKDGKITQILLMLPVASDGKSLDAKGDSFSGFHVGFCLESAEMIR